MMQYDIGRLLTRANFFYHEIGVIERLTTYLSLKKESETSLGNRLLYLARAAKEWVDDATGDCVLFLTVLSLDRDRLWVVTQRGERIASLTLDVVLSSR